MTNTADLKPKPWLSPAALYGYYLRRCFVSVGLTCQKMDINEEKTTLQFWGPSKASSKPALVFVHGFGPDATWQWRRQATFFARDFAVYVPNLVFFGESNTRSEERSEVFQAKVVGKLMEKLGVKRYSVVGTSYGGFVTYQMAKMWPDRVEKVVIASSGVNMRERDNNELLKRGQVDNIEELMLPETAEQIRKLLGLSTFRGAPDYMPNFFLKDITVQLYSEKRKEKMELLMGLSIGRDNNVSLSPLQQDILIIWGEHDQIFLLEKAKELKELLGQKARLEVIKNTSHVPQLEDEKQFNNIVKKFLHGTS